MSKLSVEYGGMVSGAEGIPACDLYKHPGVYERSDFDDYFKTVIVDDYEHVITIGKTAFDGEVCIHTEAPAYGYWKPAGFAITFRMLAP